MPSSLATIFGLPRNVWLIGIISLCNDAASEMLHPIIPLFLASALASVPLSALSDRIGRPIVLVAGYAINGTCHLVLGQGSGTAALLLCLAGYGTFAGSIEGVAKAHVADIVSEGLRGTAYAWFNMSMGLLLLPASAIFGLLYQEASPALAFGFSGACSLAAAVMLTCRAMGRPTSIAPRS